MVIIRIVFLSVVFYLLGFNLGAQEVHRMDLQTAVEVAKRQSNRMLILKEQLNGASYNLKAATSRFKTHVDLDITIPQYTETIRQWEDSLGISFYPVRQNQLSSYLRISQPLPTDGSLYIRSGIQNYIDYYADDRNAQIMSSIGLQQPIEAFFGFNNLKLYYKQAKLNYEMTLKRLKREELDMVYYVSQSFYNVLSAREAMGIADMTYQNQKTTYETAQKKLAAGLLREVEALQMEVDLDAAANQLENARTLFQAQMLAFKEELNIPLQDSIVIINDLEYNPLIVNPEQAIELAMTHRSELRESEIQIEMQEMNLKRQKAEGRIRGNILLNYNFIGVGKNNRSIPVGTTFENTWYNLMDRPGSFGVGLTATIPLIDWGENKARVKSAESVLNQNRIQMRDTRIGIEREIRSLVDQLHNALRGLEIMEKSVKVAEKSFDISRQRYENGEIDSEAMALERNRLNLVYTTRLSSYINYKLSLSDLMRKTFYDFEKGKELGAGI